MRAQDEVGYRWIYQRAILSCGGLTLENVCCSATDLSVSKSIGEVLFIDDAWSRLVSGVDACRFDLPPLPTLMITADEFIASNSWLENVSLVLASDGATTMKTVP